jgi:hypothetical protein
VIRFAVFCFYFLLFFLTRAKEINSGGSGTLLTVLSLGGQANPPGYPLLTVLAHLLNALPGDPLFKYHSFAAFLGALNMSIFYQSLRLLAERVAGTSRRFFCFFASALILTPVFYIHATSFEKYMLNLWVLALILSYLIRLHVRGQGGVKRFFFLFGLSFCTHYSTVPFALFALIMAIRWIAPSPTQIAKGLFFFSLGLLPLAGVYWFAQAEPLFNWGNPRTLADLVSHVFREQYWGGSTSWSLEEIFRQFSREAQLLWLQQGFLVISAGFLGLIELWRRNLRKLFWLFLFAVLLMGPVLTLGLHFQTRYINPVFEDFLFTHVAVFYLPLTYVVGLLAGVFFVQKALILRLALVLFLLVRMATVVQDNNRSDYQFAQNFNESFQEISGVGKKLVITHLDPLYFPLVFAQKNQGFESETIFIHTDLLKLPWFQETFRKLYPDYYDQFQNEFENYFIALRKFLADQNEFNGIKMGRAYRNLLRALVDRDSDRVAYLLFYPDYYPAPLGIFDGYFLEPMGIGYRIHREAGEFGALNLTRFDFRGLNNAERYQDHWQRFYAAYYADQVAKRAQLLFNINQQEAVNLKRVARELAAPDQIQRYQLDR